MVFGNNNGDEAHGSTCDEDTVGRIIIPLRFSSDHPNYPGRGDHTLSSDVMIETVKAETMAVGAASSANSKAAIPPFITELEFGLTLKFCFFSFYTF